MAWEEHVHYQGPNWEIYGLTANLGADVLYELAHTLEETPVVVLFTPINQAAAASGFYVDGETNAKVDIHKLAGNPGAHIHIHLALLAHPH